MANNWIKYVLAFQKKIILLLARPFQQLVHHIENNVDYPRNANLPKRRNAQVKRRNARVKRRNARVKRNN